jgi:hypothetical protein
VPTTLARAATGETSRSARSLNEILPATWKKTPEERRAAHEIIYSIFELYELKVHGFVPPAVWKIRETDIEALLSLPFFRQQLTVLENRFAKHPRFARWLEQVRRIKA